jgi:hypothetical protein
MECACTIEVDIEGAPCNMAETILTVTTEKVKCCECNEIIPVGEKYEYTMGLWDDDFSFLRTCESCLSVRNVFFNGFVYGYLWGDIVENMNMTGLGISEDCISKIHPRARGKICEIIENYWEDTD